MYIGNHLSSSKGFENMGKEALKLGADTFAFFTRNPRGGAAEEDEPGGAAEVRRPVVGQQVGRRLLYPFSSPRERTRYCYASFGW